MVSAMGSRDSAPARNWENDRLLSEMVLERSRRHRRRAAAAEGTRPAPDGPAAHDGNKSPWPPEDEDGNMTP